MKKNMPSPLATEIIKLRSEDKSQQANCVLCQDAFLSVGEKDLYGAVVITKIGTNWEDSLFATLSPKTGNNPEEDFSIQIMTVPHLTHFSQLYLNQQLSINYGKIFANVCHAMTVIMAENPRMKAVTERRDDGIALATYGKCTTWKEKKEHFHIKIFPFKGDLSQPFTVDSSFGKKEVEIDKKGEFVRMKPVRKKMIPPERFTYITTRLIKLLNN